VSGIEPSAAKVNRLKTKDCAHWVDVTIGDIASSRLQRTFGLVYLVLNRIGNLITQEEQVACFNNAGASLEPGGHFLVEAGVPDLRRLPPGQDARVFADPGGYVGYDDYIDLVAQQAVSHHVVISDHGVRESMTLFRYVWPSELDLMAKLAGMALRYRWAGWDRSPFTADSSSHISVWQKE
jgi:hypothetical protein